MITFSLFKSCRDWVFKKIHKKNQWIHRVLRFTVKHGYIEYAFNKYSNIDFITLFLKKKAVQTNYDNNA